MTDDAPSMTSHRPYLLRALYEWIADNDMTPHLLVDAGQPGVQVPRARGEGRQGRAQHRRARGRARWSWATTRCASPRASAASASRCRCRCRRCWRSTRRKPGRAWRCPKTAARTDADDEPPTPPPIRAATNLRHRGAAAPAGRQVAPRRASRDPRLARAASPAASVVQLGEATASALRPRPASGR